MALRLLFFLALNLCFGETKLLIANQTDNFNTNATITNTAIPQTQSNLTNITRNRTRTAVNEVEAIPDEKPILRVATTPHVNEHIDQLLGGLLVWAPGQLQTLTTPKTLGVLRGLLVPKPIPPIIIKPKPPVYKQDVNKTIGSKGNVIVNRTRNTDSNETTEQYGKNLNKTTDDVESDLRTEQNRT